MKVFPNVRIVASNIKGIISRGVSVMGSVLPPQEAVALLRFVGRFAPRYAPPELPDESKQLQRQVRRTFLKGVSLTGRNQAAFFGGTRNFLGGVRINIYTYDTNAVFSRISQ